MKKIVFAIPFLVLSVAGWAQHKPERDPFVNLGQKQPQVQQETHTNVPVVTTRAHHQPLARTQTPAPKLNVLGLVTNSGQPKAIVAGDKRTYIVAQGDQLGDYRVAKIDRSGITLAYKQVRYHCPLGQ
jgi:hypothetical protein